MKAIYKGGFRHSYADFFPLVVEVFKSEEYNHEYLGSNLEALKNWVAQAGMEQKQNGLDEELLEHLAKLSDHINLEIGRYSQTVESVNRLAELEQRNIDINEQLTKTFESLKKLQKKQKGIIIY